MSDTYRVWCFVEGDNQPFLITPSLTTQITDVKEMIKEFFKDGNFLNGIHVHHLTLWKPLTPIPVKPSNTLAERIRNWLPGSDSDFSKYVETLDDADSVANAFKNQNQTSTTVQLNVIVKLPARDLGRPFFKFAMLPRESKITAFTMKLWSLAMWDRLSEEDLIYNNVRPARSSQRLEEFQERLRRKRYIDGAYLDVYAAFRNYMQYSSMGRQTSWDAYFEVVIPAETNLSHLDRVTINELNHYSSVIGGLQLRNSANYDKEKESHVRALLLEFLGTLQSVPRNSWGFDTLIPFLHLVVETPDETMKYTPKSDFHMCIKNFPHFLLEVNSQPNEGDHVRMLLQAACISRIGNWLRASTRGNPIVIMAIYIDKYFMAHQSLLYQRDVGSTEVEYVTDVFDLTAPRTAFEFIFQIYNFLSEAKADNDGLHEPECRLLEAKDSVARKGYASLSERKHEETGATPYYSHGPPARRGTQDSFGDKSVQRELTRAGYTLTQPISEELTLLTPLPPTMRQATSQSGVSVVLKTIVDSNERQLLQYLNGIKAPSNHVIPLLDVIDLSIGKMIIVMPWKRPLDEVLQFGDCPDGVVSLCLQFIEGVAFLHQHKVAHCDLKPGNVVVDTKKESERLPRLFIIDFDLAQSVESEETMTEGWCGTPSWVAPELGTRNGPTQRYSPILADRWACGRMIGHFAKYFPTYEGERTTMLWTFAQRLLDINPRARPELNELQAIHGSTKRKSARSQQEPVPKRHASAQGTSYIMNRGLSARHPNFPRLEAQAQQAIPALDKANDGQDDWGDPRSLN